MPKVSKEPIERVTLKLPKSVASYFRQTFAHGRRSGFVADCILRYQREQAVAEMAEELRKAAKSRQ